MLVAKRAILVRVNVQTLFPNGGSPFSDISRSNRVPDARLLASSRGSVLRYNRAVAVGLSGLRNNERHPGFRLFMRRHRGLENALRVIPDIWRIGWIGEISRLWSVDMLQKRLYCL